MINYSLSLSPGNTLVELCKQTSKELLLVAPFIKARTLERLLGYLSSSVNLSCITRWRPKEIAAGVSDIEVYEIVKNYNGELHLRHDLHAKFFRGDNCVLIGSANLTHAALGWSADSNLEILVPISPNKDTINFEALLIKGSIQVDNDLYQSTTEAASDWKALENTAILTEGLPTFDIKSWLTICRSPPELYKVYLTPSPSPDIPASLFEAGMRDLRFLQPPLGLSREIFEKTIGATILTTPMINKIDRYLETPQRFGAVRDLLKEQLQISHEEASEAWQTVIRWLRHFLPDRYEYTRPKYSEIISKNRYRHTE